MRELATTTQNCMKVCVLVNKAVSRKTPIETTDVCLIPFFALPQNHTPCISVDGLLSEHIVGCFPRGVTTAVLIQRTRGE
jgi:hypothetical protein